MIPCTETEIAAFKATFTMSPLLPQGVIRQRLAIALGRPFCVPDARNENYDWLDHYLDCFDDYDGTGCQRILNDPQQFDSLVVRTFEAFACHLLSRD